MSEEFSLRDHFYEFTQNTTILGVSYIFGENRSWKTRLFWILIFILMVSFTVYLLIARYYAWEKDRIVSEVDEEFVYSQSLPFPAITMCLPFRMYFKNLTENLYNDLSSIDLKPQNYHRGLTINGSMLDKLDNENLAAFELASQICDFEWEMKDDDIKKYVKGRNRSNLYDKYREFDDKYRPAPEHYFTCLVYQEKVDCSKIVSVTVTDLGFCYTFNGLERKDLYRTENIREPITTNNNTELKRTLRWNLEKGYPDGEYDYPYRMNDSYSGFAVIYNLGGYHGFPHCDNPLTLSIHSPADMMKRRPKLIKVATNRNIFLTITQKIKKTDPALRSFHPKRRNCYFSDERSLKYFRVYTETNCEYECLTKFIIDECKCVPFYLPQDKEFEVCGIDDYECYVEARSKFENMRHFSDQNDSNSCDCLPNCIDIEYMTEFVDFDSSNYENEDKITGALQFNINVHKYRPTKVFEKGGLILFVSEFGGLFGLFLGMSLFSMLELVYYCFIGIFIKKSVQGREGELAVSELENVENVRGEVKPEVPPAEVYRELDVE